MIGLSTRHEHVPDVFGVVLVAPLLQTHARRYPALPVGQLFQLVCCERVHGVTTGITLLRPIELTKVTTAFEQTWSGVVWDLS